MKQFEKFYSEKKLAYLIFLATLLVLGYSYYLSVTLYSSFIIGRDEANFIIKSSIRLFSSTDTLSFIKNLFVTHGQHVLVGMQIGNIISYVLSGYVNFMFINIIGLTYIVIPSLIIAHRASHATEKYFPVFFIYFSISIALILSPGHISCAINTACTGNHYLGLGLSVVALHLFIPQSPSKNKSWLRIGLSEFTALIAILSSPAALTLIPLFFIVSLFIYKSQTKFFAINALFSPLVLFIFFMLSETSNSFDIQSFSVSSALNFIFLYILFILNLMGSVFFWPNGLVETLMCAFLGLVIISCAIFLFIKNMRALKQNPNLLFLASGFILLLGMAALIGIGRSYSFGSPRYIVYACFAFVFFILFFLSSLKPSVLKHSSIVAIMCLIYYPIQLQLNIPYINRIKQEITACNKNWYERRVACGVMIKHQEATDLLLEAQRRGVLKLPTQPN